MVNPFVDEGRALVAPPEEEVSIGVCDDPLNSSVDLNKVSANYGCMCIRRQGVAFAVVRM